jgi:hypothetical protein
MDVLFWLPCSWKSDLMNRSGITHAKARIVRAVQVCPQGITSACLE